MKEDQILKQVFILVETPLTKRDYKRFGIELMSCHFKVTVFDFCPWLQPVFWRIHADKRFEFDGYQIIASLQDFMSAVKSIPIGSVSVDYLFTGLHQTEIRKLLKSNGIERAIVFSGNLPPPRYKGGKLLYDYLRRMRNLSRLIVSIINKHLPVGVQSKDIPDIAILSGEACLNNYKAHARKQLWGHSFDYDSYLNDRIFHTKTCNTEPYAVFLDQNLTNHSDFIVSGKPPHTIDENYFPLLNSFFDFFEQLAGYRVVIAAQPRADISSYNNKFDGREIQTGKTSELVGDASIVFGHYSTAISFVALYRKPLVLLTSNDLNKTVLHFIDAFRYHLKVPLVNLNKYCKSEIDINRWSEISHFHYEKYIRLYIKKPGTPENLLWDAFSNYLLNSSQRN